MSRGLVKATFDRASKTLSSVFQIIFSIATPGPRLHRIQQPLPTSCSSVKKFLMFFLASYSLCAWPCTVGRMLWECGLVVT